ncbi:hybrid sensor histidine kinase/response regulator [Oscillatoria sp. FACHB-1407]|uniref:hybrid sensor histidine kinase/response regulator n=1 Tax=Oscillatoria sp. FACHB-1407 TaxID=2692847 RepID=UPI0016824DEC|nr:hybrid sensor histidine kinase/response regulator [Oscillatoria sp. FACHB-1407]MBD2465041.1 hybrid sensor histidine kinase/response regulator [Oscillatoria sp. FACHB-1407]
MNRTPVVLVVDDEPNGFTVIRALLKPEGYEFFYVPSGDEALTQLDAIKPDVILLDVMMPDKDGIETCREIKANSAWASIPVIMVTALNAKEDLARCLDAGADDFISKPVNRVELQARVRSLLRIKQQYDALKDTLQLREDMSSMMVHDLRTPVTTILLGSQMLLMQALLPEQHQERLKLVYRAGQQLSSMINELLLLAKLEAGSLLLNYSEIDLNVLVTTVISEFQELAQARKIYLDVQLPQSGQQITADLNLLHRLMDNLLSNAIKFSPQNSTVTLTVEYLPHATHNGQVRMQAKIHVADQGPGIKADLRPYIFNKFEIGEAMHNVPQIGLGLTFCKLVVEAHGGSIYVQDNSPQGAVFTVEL